MLYTYRARSFLFIVIIILGFSHHQTHSGWFKTDKAKRYYRISWHVSKIMTGTILGLYSLYIADKKFYNKGLIGGLGNIIGETADPKKYPTISGLIASGVCIYSGVEGLRKEI